MEEKRKDHQKFIIGLMIVAVLVLGGFIVYDKFLVKETNVPKNNTSKVDKNNKNDKEDEVNNKIEEDGPVNNQPVSLDVNNQLVQYLYSMIAHDNRCFNTIFSDIRESIGNQGKEISAADIRYETKFQMALTIMSQAETENLWCNKYDVQKYFGYKPDADNVGCGDNWYNPETNKFVDGFTALFKEDVISSQMNQIFGEGTYRQVDKVEYGGIWYKYIPEEKGYAELHIPAGGTCPNHTNELISASKEGNKIIIAEKKSYDDSSSYTFIYTFTTKNNTNYYLEKIKASKN